MAEKRYFQTADGKITICVHETKHTISIGFARAGKEDLRAGRVNKEDGMSIAEGRMIKAKSKKDALVRKNYLRGIFARKIKA